jgi:hypothetical protein
VKKIVSLVLLVIVVFCIYEYVWKPRRFGSAMYNGDIVSNDLMSPAEKTRFLRENSGEDADGQSEHKTTHGNISADDKPTAASTASLPATPATGPVYPSAATAPAASPTTVSTMGTPPAGDTIAPNPPNGMVFSGKGEFQWYRQGNITWRVNTATGRSCIVFATDEEWRKPRVLSHGCGGNA